MDNSTLMQRYAEVAVHVGINLQKDQHVLINAKLEHAPFVELLAAECYRAGAGYVIVAYLDDRVRRALIEHGPEGSLGWTPPHLLTAMSHIVEVGGARINVTGDAEPNLMDPLDPVRVGKARMVELSKANLAQVNDRSVNWTIVACPNAGWAEQVFGEPDVDKLWDAVARATRLYDDDPVKSWWAHVDTLAARTEALDALELDALRFEGDGTDLTIGLHRTGRWTSANFATASGIRHVPNLPTEEVFTTPDYRRVEGTVRATKPLHLPHEGLTVNDLVLRFEEGRITDVQASTGAEVIKTQIATDPGAAQLGEVALVDRASAVGDTGVTFCNTLFDENATSHIAYGAAYAFCVEATEGLGAEELLAMGVNHSSVHTDLMIGGPAVEVSGLTPAGDRLPIITNNVWQL